MPQDGKLRWLKCSKCGMQIAEDMLGGNLNVVGPGDCPGGLRKCTGKLDWVEE